MSSRPHLHRANSDAEAAVERLIDHLQRGFDIGNADIYDEMFAEDILWGTPKGLVLEGYNRLNPIHHRMMDGVPVAPASRFELAQIMLPAPDVAVAQIRRTALNGGFSEMAMYVLIKHEGQWWVAGGHNTPVNDRLPPPTPNR
ncbi:DUF4440 domain-containing protein [Gordonia sp. NPDC003429]